MSNRYGLFLEQDITYVDADGGEHCSGTSKLVAIAQDPDALKALCAPRNPASCALWFDDSYILHGYIVDFDTGCEIMTWGVAEGAASGSWMTIEEPRRAVRVC